MKIEKIKHQWKVTYTNKNGAKISVWFRNQYEARALKRQLNREGITVLVEYIKTEYYKPEITVTKVAI